MAGSFSGVGNLLQGFPENAQKAFKDNGFAGLSQWRTTPEGIEFTNKQNKKKEQDAIDAENHYNQGTDWLKLAAGVASLPFAAPLAISLLGGSSNAGASSNVIGNSASALPLAQTLFGTSNGQKGLLSNNYSEIASGALNLAAPIISANTQANALNQQRESNEALQKLALDLQYGTNFSGNNPNGNTGELEKARQFQESILGKQQGFQGEQAEKERGFASGESALNRALQQQLLTQQQTYGSSEAEKERQAQEKILGLQQGFTGNESALNRALQEKLLEQQQSYGAGESALDRAQQEKMFGLQSGEAEKGRKFTSSENALNRALQERGIKLNEQQFASNEDQRRLAQQAAQAGETGFLNETSQENPAINQLIENIRMGKNRDIQESENQLRANLYKSGVRGTRGSSLIGQQTGQLTENAMRDINTLKSQADLDRKKTRQQYFANKALAGFGRS